MSLKPKPQSLTESTMTVTQVTLLTDGVQIAQHGVFQDSFSVSGITDGSVVTASLRDNTGLGGDLAPIISVFKTPPNAVQVRLFNAGGADTFDGNTVVDIVVL